MDQKVPSDQGKLDAEHLCQNHRKRRLDEVDLQEDIPPPPKQNKKERLESIYNEILTKNHDPKLVRDIESDYCWDWLEATPKPDGVIFYRMFSVVVYLHDCWLHSSLVLKGIRSVKKRSDGHVSRIMEDFFTAIIYFRRAVTTSIRDLPWEAVMLLCVKYAYVMNSDNAVLFIQLCLANRCRVLPRWVIKYEPEFLLQMVGQLSMTAWERSLHICGCRHYGMTRFVTIIYDALMYDSGKLYKNMQNVYDS